MWWASSAQHVAWCLSIRFGILGSRDFSRGKVYKSTCLQWVMNVSGNLVYLTTHSSTFSTVFWNWFWDGRKWILHVTYFCILLITCIETHIRQQHTSVVVAAFDWHGESQEVCITQKGKEETESTLVKWQRVRIYSYQKYCLRNGNLVLVMLMGWKLIFYLCLTCQSGSRIKGNFKSK